MLTNVTATMKKLDQPWIQHNRSVLDRVLRRMELSWLKAVLLPRAFHFRKALKERNTTASVNEDAEDAMLKI